MRKILWSSALPFLLHSLLIAGIWSNEFLSCTHKIYEENLHMQVTYSA